MMKFKSLILFSIITSGTLLYACSWDTPLKEAFLFQEDFVSCPPDEEDGRPDNIDPKERKLVYIGTQDCTIDSLENCEGNKSIFKYAFETKHCPRKYPTCARIDDTYTKYSCRALQCKEGLVECTDEEGNVSCKNPALPTSCGITSACDDGDICENGMHCYTNDESNQFMCQLECPKDLIECQKEDGSYYCANPESLKTCGITSACNDGVQCGKLQSCQLDDNKFRCQCPEGYTKSGSDCINPLDPLTCGANTDNPDGIQCGQNQKCTAEFNSETGFSYRCECYEGLVMCNGVCINPLTNNEHCGKASKCEYLPQCQSDQFCYNGECKCENQGIWCEEINKCARPHEPETCGVDEHCNFVTCSENEVCVLKGEKYICEKYKCNDDELLCDVNGINDCIKNDINHCGNCFKDCTKIYNLYSQDGICKLDEATNTYDCEYKCTDGYHLCDGKCYSDVGDSNHCGTDCQKCDSGYVCKEGTCVKNECSDNQCRLQNSGTSSYACVSRDTACGRDCQNCTLFGSTCAGTKCISLDCNSNEHPVYTDDVVTQCVENTIDSCAPKDMPPNETPTNCRNTFIAQANESICNEAGKCVPKDCINGFILSANKDFCECPEKTHFVNQQGICTELISTCDINSHVSEDRMSCIQNNNNSCATPNWNGSPDYEQYVHACNELQSCIEGTCTCPTSIPTQCNNICVDTSSDTQNCGKCGNQCLDKSTCQNGSCKCQSSSLLYCNNKCINPSNDKTNCGSCNKKCAGNLICSNNKCTCSTGLTNCNNTCVNTKTNKYNCGRCGNKCGNSKTCKGGKCLIYCSSLSTCSNCKNNKGASCTNGTKTGKCKKNNKGVWYCNV